MIPDVFPKTCPTCNGTGRVDNPIKPPKLFGVEVELFMITEMGEIPIETPKTILCPTCNGNKMLFVKNSDYEGLD